MQLRSRFFDISARDSVDLFRLELGAAPAIFGGVSHLRVQILL